MEADICDVGAPDLVHVFNVHSFEQIRVDGVLRMARTRVAFGLYALNTHLPHQSLHPLVVDWCPVAVQLLGNASGAVEGTLGVDLINLPHERAVIFFLGAVVVGGPADAEQLALAGNGDLGMTRIYQLLALPPSREFFLTSPTRLSV